MSAAINRGRGRPSKGLRKFIGFRVQEKIADDVALVAAAKGLSVSEYVSSAVHRSLHEDLAVRDYFNQEEFPQR